MPALKTSKPATKAAPTGSVTAPLRASLDKALDIIDGHFAKKKSGDQVDRKALAVLLEKSFDTSDALTIIGLVVKKNPKAVSIVKGPKGGTFVA